MEQVPPAHNQHLALSTSYIIPTFLLLVVLYITREAHNSKSFIIQR